MKKIPALDGLRALAIILVLGVHFNGKFFPGGGIGVDMFFALSGFLISSILISELEKTNHISLSRFYLRRVLRLLPAYVVMICVTIVITNAIGPHFHRLEPFKHDTLSNRFSAITYWSDIWTVLHHGAITLYGQTWSLAIEEHFYLIWPFMLLGGWKLFGRRGMLAATWVALIVNLGWAWRINAVDGGAYYYRFDVRSAALLAGCVLALYNLKPRDSQSARIVASFTAFGGLLYIFYLAHTRNTATVYPSIYTAVATCLVIGSIKIVPKTYLAWPLSLRPLVTLGNISYGVYLFNTSVAFILYSNYSNLSGWTKFGIGSGMAICLGSASYLFVEKPFLDLKSRMGQRGSHPQNKYGQNGRTMKHDVATSSTPLVDLSSVMSHNPT